jgi:hypothetical protein
MFTLPEKELAANHILSAGLLGNTIFALEKKPAPDYHLWLSKQTYAYLF